MDQKNILAVVAGRFVRVLLFNIYIVLVWNGHIWAAMLSCCKQEVQILPKGLYLYKEEGVLPCVPLQKIHLH